MQLDDETKDLLHFLRGSDILWMADKLGRKDELLDRLRANMAEENRAPDRDHDGNMRPGDTETTLAVNDMVADARLVDDGDDTNGRELVKPEPRSARGADISPERTELTFGEPRLIMLAGPRWAARADYEAFIEAGGEVNTRGFDLELRGESLDEKTVRLEREARAAKLAALKAEREAFEAEEARAAAELAERAPERLSDRIAPEAEA